MAIIPPVGTSAYKAYQYSQRANRSPTWDGLENIRSFVTGHKPAYAQSGPMSDNGAFRTIASSAINDYKSVLSGASSALRGPSGGGFASSGSSASPGGSASPGLDYYQAALAGHYGMDATTAYQEALANTSYQRSVQDLLNAGLNPAALFAAGRVSGAQGVGYATQLGSGFVDSGSSGGGSARSKQLFSKGLYNTLSLVGGTIAAVKTKTPFAFSVGQTAAKAVMSTINSLFR